MLPHPRLAVLSIVGLIALIPILDSLGARAEWVEHETSLKPLVLPVPGAPMAITNPKTGQPYQCHEAHAIPSPIRRNIVEWECLDAGRLRAITLPNVQDLASLVTHTGTKILAQNLRIDPPGKAAYATERVAWTSYATADESPADPYAAPKILAITGSDNSALVVVDLQDHESFKPPTALQSARDQALAQSNQTPHEITPAK